MPAFDGPPPSSIMTPKNRDLMLAVIELLKRSGMREFQIRYDEEEQPTVWVGVARFDPGAQCGAGFDPMAACRDLAERCVTGGRCINCGKMIELNFGERDDPPAFPPDQVCYRMYHRKQKTFVRGCDSIISN